jgi:hypothetical protein
MSYQTEHKRMKPVLQQARVFDIATNPDPLAIFEAGSGGFQLWCIPKDCPKGWEGLRLDAGAFSKPCGYVASVYWGWGEGDQEEQITHVALSTTAYVLADRKPEKFTEFSVAMGRRGIDPMSIQNRPADIRWAKKKIRWLFKKAGVRCPQIVVEKEG